MTDDPFREFGASSAGDPVVIEEQRRAHERDAIGPRALKYVEGLPEGTAFFAEVDWTDGLERVRRAARLREVDSASQWVMFKRANPERLSCALEIEWSKPDVRVVLYFDFPEHGRYLEYLAREGVIGLVPVGVKARELMEGVLTVQCDSPMLNAFAWASRGKIFG